MKTTILCLFLLLSSALFSKERDLTEDEKAKIHGMLEKLIETTHTSLQKPNLKIILHTINNPAYFFESNFGAARALLGKRKYKIGVNPLVFDKNIPDDALYGVLAHELIHTEDYASGNTFNTLIPIGWAVLKKKTKIQYERKTDLKVIMKGLDRELIAYKSWQYPLLDPKDLITKKKEYLSPEEVKLVAEIRDTHPEILEEWLKYKIPLNKDGIELSLINKKKLFANHLFSIDLKGKFNRKRRGKKFFLSLKTKKIKLLGCTLKGIPFNKKGYNFDEQRVFKVKELSPDKVTRLNFSFRGKMNGVDLILKDCANSEELFIKGYPTL